MAKKVTMTITGSNQTKQGSDSASVIDVIKVYGNSNTVKAQNGNDQVTVYKGKNHKIYGDAGKDILTVTKNAQTGIKVYGGSGNDNIKIQGGSKVYAYGEAGNDKLTVSGGNNHVLTGGAGSDTYILSAAMSKDTSLTISQAGAKSGDEDILQLTNTNRGDISFSYNSSKKILTATHKTGGKVAVKSWATKPLAEVQFANNEYVHVIAGDNSKTLNGTGRNDYILAGSANTTVKAGKGNDTVAVAGGSKNSVYGGAGNDTITVSGGTGLYIYGDANNDVIRIKGGSGHVINSGTGNDKIYVDGGSVKSIVNAGGTDYIEIGKNAGSGIKVESVGASEGYKLVAKETVSVLGGSNHDIRLYGGNDKVIIAGGSGHTVYTDGPTGSGDEGGDDIIVIQDGGQADLIVAGKGNDVIAVTKGAGNGSKIYTGYDRFNSTSIESGINTVNLLGGSGHQVYLNGGNSIVTVAAKNVTLNQAKNTIDTITVECTRDGIGTLRINSAENKYGNTDTLTIRGASYEDFSFTVDNNMVVNNGMENYQGKGLVMKFTGTYYESPNVQRYYIDDGRTNNNQLGTITYNWNATNGARVDPVYNDGGQAIDATIEISRWSAYWSNGGIAFIDKNGISTYKSYSQIKADHGLLL